MFLIAELPEFTKIRLIYQTKQKNHWLCSKWHTCLLRTAQYTVYTAYNFLKNSVWNSIQYTTYVSE